uniref:NADH-ubiquinone oxidoreductase chain 6 n=1 Tax=Ptiliidae sp. BMNH 1274723 TaxID=1796536 RepID=A0A126TGD0_9COLE|nr:NADH dehydrogenase subunit 6 [Ptiliidae sp. BMNH 1274723]
MLCMIFSKFLLLMTMMLMFINHPLSMNLILILITITIALTNGFMNSNFWFSYMLFLIMIGGLMIIFMYMTNTMSNQKFQFSFKNFLIMFTLLIMLLLINFDHQMIHENISWSPMNNSSLLKFINLPSMMLMILMINYLLITLVATVKITKFYLGPFRQN